MGKNAYVEFGGVKKPLFAAQLYLLSCNALCSSSASRLFPSNPLWKHKKSGGRRLQVFLGSALRCS